MYDPFNSCERVNPPYDYCIRNEESNWEISFTVRRTAPKVNELLKIMPLNLYIHLSNPPLFGTEKRDTNKKYSTLNALSRIELFVTTKNVVT